MELPRQTKVNHTVGLSEITVSFLFCQNRKPHPDVSLADWQSHADNSVIPQWVNIKKQNKTSREAKSGKKSTNKKQQHLFLCIFVEQKKWVMYNLKNYEVYTTANTTAN